MEDRNFRELLDGKDAQGKFLCVGLDPQFRKPEDFPEGVRRGQIDAMLIDFLVPIIEATADIAAWYKPNLAYYLRHGWKGVLALEKLYAALRKKAEDCVHVHDSKNGDIGDTNDAYAEFVFDVLGADAVTLHNYMGMQAMEPFLRRPNKGNFVLVRTSNPGNDEFQGLLVQTKSGTQPLYVSVAEDIENLWNTPNSNCGVVAGASPSAIEELAQIRESIGETIPILCPGVGKQGGSAAQAYMLGSNRAGGRIGVNQSSDITHAHRKPEYEDLHWAEAARLQAQKTHDEMAAATAA